MKSLRFLVYMAVLLIWLNGSRNESGQAYQVTSNTQTPSGTTMIEQTKIVTVYDNAPIEGIPVIVPFSDEQRKYVIELLAATVGVMEQTSDLETTESMIFGEGKFFWPKDPAKPVRTSQYYPEENFRMPGIALSFDREDERSRWQKANLVILPPNFPKGVYGMDLPPSVFRNFTLIKCVQETRPLESISNPLVFYFSNNSVHDLRLKVEARADVVGAHSPYPSTFYRIDISRDPARK